MMKPLDSPGAMEHAQNCSSRRSLARSSLSIVQDKNTRSLDEKLVPPSIQCALNAEVLLSSS